jgi:alpha-L-rhamnosidase
MIRITLHALIALTSLCGIAAAAQVNDLRCEYLVNPLGIDVVTPRLSWKLEPGAQGLRQTAYRMLVASTPELLASGKADLWDSGDVDSDQNVHVIYGGKPLKSRAQCLWTVRVRDEYGKWSPWSNPALWTMGLLGAGDWSSAKWVGLDEAGPEASQEHRKLPSRMLRKGFRTEKAVRRATVTLCGLGFYELYINGQKVGDRLMDPGLTEYSKRCPYVTFDVTELLKKGDNAIGVILGNGRFFAPRLNVPVPTVSFGYPKLLLDLHTEHVDGSTAEIVSDESWKITTDGPTRTNSEYDGEEYDAQLEQDGWASPGFDDAKWKSVQLVPPPGGALQAQMVEPVRVTEVLKAVSITEPKPGIFVADFGQAFYGMPKLSVSGPRGARVEMRSSFNVKADGTLNTDNDRSAQNTDVYTLRGTGKTETWHPRFKGNAIRRVQVTGFPGKLTPENIGGLVVHTDHEAVGEFSCSNDLINRIYLNARWGTRMQNRSIPMEPDRDERQGWSGHPAKTSESEGFAFNVAPFYSSWLHSIRLDQHADGSLQEISPGYWTFSSNGTIWPAVVTIIPNWMYDFYGDTRVLADNYDSSRRWVEYHIHTNQKPDGTLDQVSYPDWVDASWIGKRHDQDSSGTSSKPFISTAYHYHNLRLLARSAKLLGKSDDAAKFDAVAAKVKDGFNTRFFKPAENRYDFGNQFSFVLPLAFGLVPDTNRQAVMNRLVKQVMETDKGFTTVGLLGMQWQMQVLTDIGHPEVAYAIATKTDRPSWGYMISKGATTIWERWDTDTQDGGMNGESQKILSGNFEAWCYQTLGGINYDPEQPGFKHVILRPHVVGDLKWAKASHRSMYGTITSEWSVKDGKRFEWTVMVPPNTTATVHVPGGKTSEVQSGTYKFESNLP